MLSTIRETLTSLKDKSYGNTIVTKRMWPTIWYWTKYLLVFTVVPWIVFIFLLTYFLPQLPKFLRDNLPDKTVTLTNGHFSTSFPDGTRIGDKSFSLIIDTKATSSSALTDFDSGILIASTGAFLKSSDGSSDSAQFPSNLNFSTSKSQILSWINTHQFPLWLACFIALTVLTLIIAGFYWIYNLATFAFGGLILWLVARTTHHQLDYRGAVKIAIYASVLPLLVGALISLAPNPLTSLISLGLFLYFGINWVVKLPNKTQI